MTREEFWMQIYIRDWGSNKESLHADKALAEFYDRFPVKRESSNEDSSEWVEYSGKVCPVSDKTHVQVWLAGWVNPPTEGHWIAEAREWNWGNVIKYRVVKG